MRRFYWRVQQDDEAQRLGLALAEFQIEGLAAARDASFDRSSQVQPTPSLARTLAAREARAHRLRKP